MSVHFAMQLNRNISLPSTGQSSLLLLPETQEVLQSVLSVQGLFEAALVAALELLQHLLRPLALAQAPPGRAEGQQRCPLFLQGLTQVLQRAQKIEIRTLDLRSSY